MERISERIVNIADLEAKIREDRLCADHIVTLLSNGDLQRGLYMARKLSLALHELSEFELCLEQRKVNFIEE